MAPFAGNHFHCQYHIGGEPDFPADPDYAEMEHCIHVTCSIFIYLISLQSLQYT